MPCYDGREDAPRIVYQNGVDPGPYQRDIQTLKDSVKSLTAGLCALMSELEEKGIANEIISRASKRGLINLMDFWVDHKKDDETRLAKELHKFSEQEQSVLKKLLNKE